MVPRENKNNAYAKFWRENKEYYGIFESGLLQLVVSRATGDLCYMVPVLLASFKNTPITLQSWLMGLLLFF